MLAALRQRIKAFHEHLRLHLAEREKLMLEFVDDHGLFYGARSRAGAYDRQVMETNLTISELVEESDAYFARAAELLIDLDHARCRAQQAPAAKKAKYEARALEVIGELEQLSAPAPARPLVGAARRQRRLA